MNKAEAEKLKGRDPARLAAKLLLDMLDRHCGERPVWKPEMELLRVALELGQ